MYRFIGQTGTVIGLSRAAYGIEGVVKALREIGYRRTDAQAGVDPVVTLRCYGDGPSGADCAATLALIAEDHVPDRRALTRLDAWAFLPVRPEELELRIGQLSAARLPPERSEDFSKLGLIGRDPAFLRSLSRLERYAASGVHVLVCGETGVGKEKVARAIHYCGPSADGPFIPINCGAFPNDLFENELFGHRAGAFTGGGGATEGLIRQADGGTLFLDEIDALNPASQVVLLRFLQDKTYRRLGGGKVRQSSARIVAATNCRIGDAVAEGRFRSDLLFRLDVARIEIPNLADRPQDITLLAEHFIQKLSAEIDGPGRAFSSGMTAWMQTHDWPGNVRELENFVARELICATQAVIGKDAVQDEAPPDDATPPCFQRAKTAAITRFERQYLTEVMRRAHGNVTLAARMSGKERRAFARLLQKYDLTREAFLADRDRDPSHV